jgi:hypothetical protein
LKQGRPCGRTVALLDGGRPAMACWEHLRRQVLTAALVLVLDEIQRLERSKRYDDAAACYDELLHLRNQLRHRLLREEGAAGRPHVW